MTANEDHFAEFEPHTLLKHAVLYGYLQAWGFKLVQSKTRPRSRVWFLDGFAGAGCDKKGNPGSPEIACQVAKQVSEKFPDPPRRLDIICIEKEKKYFDRLEQHLKSCHTAGPPAPLAMHGDFGDRCADALAAIGNEPVFAFLDPFGIKGLKASSYRPLMTADGSEIFMLAADAGAARLSGVINAKDDRFHAVSERILAAPRLFPELDLEDLDQNEEKRRIRREALDRTTDGIRRSLIDALGETHAARLMRLDTSSLSTEFVATLEAVLRDAGAHYVTKFRVRDMEGQEKHLLVHATASAVGVLAMKDAIRRALGEERLPALLRERLRQDLMVDLEPILDRAAEVHAGKTMPLARDVPGSLQDDLLVATPVFPHQLSDLKKLIKTRRWFGKLDGKEAVTFPTRA